MKVVIQELSVENHIYQDDSNIYMYTLERRLNFLKTHKLRATE